MQYHWPASYQPGLNKVIADHTTPIKQLNLELDQFERNLLERTLRRTKGNVIRATALLGITRQLYNIR